MFGYKNNRWMKTKCEYKKRMIHDCSKNKKELQCNSKYQKIEGRDTKKKIIGPNYTRHQPSEPGHLVPKNFDFSILVGGNFRFTFSKKSESRCKSKNPLDSLMKYRYIPSIYHIFPGTNFCNSEQSTQFVALFRYTLR